MQNTEINWIGQVPKLWEKCKAKYLVSFINGYAFDSSELTNEGKYSVIRIGDINNGTINYENVCKINSNNNLEKYKITSDDLLIAMSGATIGKMAIANDIKDDIYINQRVGIIRCGKSINNKFMFYSLLTNEFLKYVLYQSWGSAQPNISSENINNYIIAIPSIVEQEKIANFLDIKISEIENVIEKTKETIEDYKKYKKNFIIKVTTKGLDKNAEMKDTDSGWIGKIPKHWDFVRINTLFHTVDERNEDENAMLLSLYTSIGVKPRSELEEKGNKAVTVLNYKKVKENDIIVNKLLAWMGAIAYSDYEGVTSPDYDVYRAKEKANVVRNYYNAYFRYTNFSGDCHRYGHGIMLMRWRTYPEELLRIKVPNPPYDEQVKIAKAIDDKCSEIDKLIENKEKIIEELEQYKKSLIYEYVTGKKEVV